MTHVERMMSGLIYDTTDEEVAKLQRPFQEKLWRFNQLSPFDGDKKQAYLKEVFAECGEGCFIELPFRASWGGAHVHFGNGIYVNSGVTFIDDGHIYVGSRVLIGPNVVVATANHPLDPELRRYELQYVKDVFIGENVWIGAGAVILPGVTIGKNSVIGAGSIVTRDIPDNVLAVGNPCNVVREIGERDREFYSSRDDKVDWEELDGVFKAKRGLTKFQ